MERICVIGSGNWGSCIAGIIGANLQRLAPADELRWGKDAGVSMWVYEEMIAAEDGTSVPLSHIINTRHENVKYLKGHLLPCNVLAVPDLAEAARDATLLVFVVPHQFVAGICETLKGRLAPQCRAISLIKGLDLAAQGCEISLVSRHISSTLQIDVSVLMGANLANDIARKFYSEATLGGLCCANLAVWSELLQTEYFQLTMVSDVTGVELCGALKNIVATAAGFVDGLFADGGGDNSKAAIIRRGLVEMRDFSRLLDPSVQDSTFFESCGVADVITSSYGGRNRRVAEAFVRAEGAKTLEQLETEILGGMKLQGAPTAAVVHRWLQAHNLEGRFPIMTLVYRICYENVHASALLKPF